MSWHRRVTHTASISMLAVCTGPSSRAVPDQSIKDTKIVKSKFARTCLHIAEIIRIFLNSTELHGMHRTHRRIIGDAGNTWRARRSLASNWKLISFQNILSCAGIRLMRSDIFHSVCGNAERVREADGEWQRVRLDLPRGKKIVCN